MLKDFLMQNVAKGYLLGHTIKDPFKKSVHERTKTILENSKKFIETYLRQPGGTEVDTVYAAQEKYRRILSAISKEAEKELKKIIPKSAELIPGTVISITTAAADVDFMVLTKDPYGLTNSLSDKFKKAGFKYTGTSGHADPASFWYTYTKFVTEDYKPSTPDKGIEVEVKIRDGNAARQIIGAHRILAGHLTHKEIRYFTYAKVKLRGLKTKGNLGSHPYLIFFKYQMYEYCIWLAIFSKRLPRPVHISKMDKFTIMKLKDAPEYLGFVRNNVSTSERKWVEEYVHSIATLYIP